MDTFWLETSPAAITLMVPMAFVAFLLGGIVKGALGLGMPVTVVSILCLATDVRTSAMLVLAPVLVTNLWQCWGSGRWLRSYRQYWRLTVSMSIVLLVTSFVSAELSQKLIMVSVGLAVVIFAIANLWLRTMVISDRMDPPAQYAAGVATGVLGGLSGLIVVPLAIYFTARVLDKDLFVHSTAPFFFLGAGLLCIGYTSGGVLKADTMLQSSMLVAPAIVGLLVGEKLRSFIPDERFRPLVLAMFLCTGVSLLQRGLAG